jgi:hypothetical protein
MEWSEILKSIYIPELCFLQQVPLCREHLFKTVAETLHSDFHRTKVKKRPTKLVPQASAESGNPCTLKRSLSASARGREEKELIAHYSRPRSTLKRKLSYRIWNSHLTDGLREDLHLRHRVSV